MSTVLQIFLLIALLAFIVLIVCLIPLVFHIRRKLTEVVLATQKLQADIETLVQDSRQMVQNVDAIAKQINEQVADASLVVHTAVQWTGRVNRLVEAVGSIVEPPILGIARKANLFRLGVSMFMQVLLAKKANKNQNEENDHV
ncbi:MAG: DUF948 domain-containing protein [Victivallaceae bacterium]